MCRTRMPAVCTIITANYTAREATAAAEPNVETAKIQAALDQCPQGQAVQLAANNEREFRRRPLRIPSGVSCALIVT